MICQIIDDFGYLFTIENEYSYRAPKIVEEAIRINRIPFFGYGGVKIKEAIITCIYSLSFRWGLIITPSAEYAQGIMIKAVRNNPS